MSLKVKVTADLSKLIKLTKKLDKMSDKGVKVGVLASKGGHEARDSGITMIELAAIHELGSPAAGIPERSMIRAAFEDPAIREEQKKVLAKLNNLVIAGALSPEKALQFLGTWAVSKIKNRITQTNIPPPLKPATVAKKGSSKPLVDTGQLLNAMNFEVE